MKMRPITPFGAILEADHNECSMLDVPKEIIIEQLEENSLLLMRGYRELQDNEYITFAKQFGKLLAWEFGEILELKIKSKPANHIFTKGRVELHWDGAFVSDKPRYNLFQCLHGSNEDAGGETLFVNTEKVLQKASRSEKESWFTLSIEYSTEKKAHYGGKIEQSLIDKNPFSNRDVIRYIEAFNEDNADINPMTVKVTGLPEKESNEFLVKFNKYLYREDVMYRHTWRSGDFLIADNSCLLHGRSKFNDAYDKRHIKRINIL